MSDRPSRLTVSSRILRRRITRSLLAGLLAGLVVALLLPAGAEAKGKKKKRPSKAGADEALVIGQVVNMSDENIPGVRITVTPAGGSDGVAQAVADSDGLFHIVVAEPEGEYRFRLVGEGYAPFEGTLPLTAGETAELAFKLLDAETGQKQTGINLFNKGAEAYNSGDLATAKEKFLAAVEADPTMPQAWFGLADVYYDGEELEKSAEAVEKFLVLEPGDDNGLALAYTVHRDLGNTERTAELVDALGQTDKAGAIATQIYNEGVRATQDGDSAKAIERFARAAELDPGLVAAHSALGTLYYNVERYDDAVTSLDQLFELDPENVQGRRIHFLIYDALNDPQKREETLEAYLAVDVDGAVDAMYQRADMDFRAGNTAAAKTAVERILELRPEMPRAHYTLGLIYIQSEPAKARSHLQKFIDLAPDDPEASTAKEILSGI